MKHTIQQLAGNRWIRSIVMFSIVAITAWVPSVQSQNRDGRPTQRVATRQYNEYRRFLNNSETGFAPRDAVLDSNERLLALDTSRIDSRAVRQLLDRFADDAVRLADEMDRAYRCRLVPGIREYLSDAAKLQARVDALARESNRGYDMRRVASDFQAIDRDWRRLDHGLTQLKPTGTSIPALIKRINEHDKRLTDIFNIRPQVDRGELIAIAATLRTDLLNLADDIELEYGTSSESYDHILTTRKLSEDMRHVQRMVRDDRPVNEVVQEYERFRRTWSEFVGNATSLQNRYVTRGIRRVTAVENQLREVLLLPAQTNRAELLQMTDSLMRDVDTFMSRTPLKLIIKLDDADAAIATADEFNEYCKELRYCVSNKQSISEVRDCFASVQRTGARFIGSYRPLGSQAAQAVLREIENELATFASAINFTSGSGYTQRELQELVTTLDNLAEHVEFDVREWLKDTRPTYANEAMRAATRFADDCHALNESILRSQLSSAQVKTKVDEINKAFIGMYHKYMRNAADSHKEHLVQTSARVHEALFDLQQVIDL